MQLDRLPAWRQDGYRIDKPQLESWTIMPLLKLETTFTLSDDKRKTLLASLSRIVSETIGKPEQYVMVTISPTAIMMSGASGDAAFADLRSIGGLGPDVNRRLSQKLCQLLDESLAVPPNRVYLNFTDVRAGNWGWNGATFG
jgi:phenylpyruvate tautomerase